MVTSQSADMRDVAQRARVSTATVSRVMNHQPRVRSEVRERVWAAASELGYSRDQIARSLRTRRTMTVGAIMSDLDNPVVSAIYKGAVGRLKEADYLTFVLESSGNIGTEVEIVNSLFERRIDGLLWSVSDETSPSLIAALNRAPVPVVTIERRVSETPWDSVVADHYTAMECAVEDLVADGHTRIAIIPGLLHQWPGRERLRAFRQVMSKYGLNPNNLIALVEGEATVEKGEMLAGLLLSGNPKPTALIAGGNRIVLGALSSAEKLGIRVPAELAFIASTIPDPDLSSMVGLPFGSIAMPASALGRLAGERLLERLGSGIAIPREDYILPARYRTPRRTGDSILDEE